jgi:CO/xanthine dehydrogenase Mo-binding subunit
MRLLHAGDDPHRPRAAANNPEPTRAEIVEAISGISAAAPDTPRSEAVALAERMRGLNQPASDMSAPTKQFRFVSTDRRARGSPLRRGQGRFAADIVVRRAPCERRLRPSGRAHPAHRQDGALALPGVHYHARRPRACRATSPLLAGLDTPNVPRRPLAVEVARYSGEWVAAVVADTRAPAEDAAERVAVDYEPLPLCSTARRLTRRVVPWCTRRTAVLLDRTFVGASRAGFAASPHRLSYQVKWGRSSTVLVEMFGVAAS